MNLEILVLLPIEGFILPLIRGSVTDLRPQKYLPHNTTSCPQSKHGIYPQRRGMLAKYGLRDLAANFDSRHMHRQIVVTLMIAPLLSCGHSALHKSTTSTRLTLRNLRTLLLILDITMNAPPAIYSLTKNPTPSPFSDYSVVQSQITSTPQTRRKKTMQLTTLHTTTKESPDTSIPTMHAALYHYIGSSVLDVPTISIPCLLRNATMPLNI